MSALPWIIAALLVAALGVVELRDRLAAGRRRSRCPMAICDGRCRR